MDTATLTGSVPVMEPIEILMSLDELEDRDDAEDERVDDDEDLEEEEEDWDDEDDDEWDDEEDEDLEEEEEDWDDEDDDEWDDEPLLETRFRGLMEEPDDLRGRVSRPSKGEPKSRKGGRPTRAIRNASRPILGDEDDEGLD